MLLPLTSALAQSGVCIGCGLSWRRVRCVSGSGASGALLEPARRLVHRMLARRALGRRQLAARQTGRQMSAALTIQSTIRAELVTWRSRQQRGQEYRWDSRSSGSPSGSTPAGGAGLGSAGVDGAAVMARVHQNDAAIANKEKRGSIRISRASAKGVKMDGASSTPSTLIESRPSPPISLRVF